MDNESIEREKLRAYHDEQKKAQEIILNEIKEKNKLSALFVKFIQRRFPRETEKYYLQEWADRFKSGNVHLYMDWDSLAIYKELLENQ